MFYTYNRGLPDSISQARLADDQLARIQGELRAANIVASNSFIPSVEESWRHYLAQKERADKLTPADARNTIKEASDKLGEAKIAIDRVYQLLIHSVNEFNDRQRWETTFNEIEQKLAEGMTSVGLTTRTPKNIDEVILSKSVGRALDEHTNQRRTTTEGGIWENIVCILLEISNKNPTNMHRIILEADNQLKIIDDLLGAVNKSE